VLGIEEFFAKGQKVLGNAINATRSALERLTGLADCPGPLLLWKKSLPWHERDISTVGYWS